MLEAISYTWLAAVGALMTSHGSPQIVPMVLACASAFTIALCVYVYNDVTDEEMDILNPTKSARPLPAKKATRAEALNFVYLMGIISMILPLFVNLELSLLCAFWLGWFIVYSTPHVRLKKRLILKEGTPALGYFLATIAGAKAVGPITLPVMFGGMMSGIFIFFSLPAFRDTQDVKEDTLYGVKSLATILPWKRRLEMVIICVLGIMTLTPLTYANLGLNVIFPIVTVAMGFVLLRVLLPLHKGIEEKRFKTALKFGTSYFFLIQISLILGALPALL